VFKRQKAQIRALNGIYGKNRVKIPKNTDVFKSISLQKSEMGHPKSKGIRTSN